MDINISTIIIGALAWLLVISLVTIFMMARQERDYCICTYYDEDLCDDCEDCD